MPKIGVGVMVFRDGKVLMHQRNDSSHGVNEYSLPGGHLEYMESFENCAKREVKEESGLEIKNIRFICVSNIKKYAPKHYITIGVAADWVVGEPLNLEPDRGGDWQWYDLDSLPSPIFEMSKMIVDGYRKGLTYYDF